MFSLNRRTRPLIYYSANLFAEQGAGAKVPNETKMPWRRKRVNPKAERGIYLVDNKDGGMNFTLADVYCAELELSRGFSLIIL
jgi:hypothetical protein